MQLLMHSYTFNIFLIFIFVRLVLILLLSEKFVLSVVLFQSYSEVIKNEMKIILIEEMGDNFHTIWIIHYRMPCLLRISYSTFIKF